MRIEKLLPPTPPAKTWTVALEGGKTLRVTESTVLDQGLFAGLELDEAALDALRSAAASAAVGAGAADHVQIVLIAFLTRCCHRCEHQRRQKHGKDLTEFSHTSLSLQSVSA